jgi:hypothetical protein
MRQRGVDLGTLVERAKALVLAGLLALVLVVPALAEGGEADDPSGTIVDGDPWAASTTTTSTTWRDICVRQQVRITAIGMGDRHQTVNPQTVTLVNPSRTNWLLAQVAGRGEAPPESVTLTTDAPQSLTLSAPRTRSAHGYTFETNLQPTRRITASVSGVGESFRTPRGLVLYSRQAARNRWVSIGKTTLGYVWRGSENYAHTEVLSLPPLAEPVDLYVSAVVIDNDDVSRLMVVEATAGGVTESVSEFGTTNGAGLNVVDMILPQVPAGISRLKVTLRSPSENGDSLVLVGLNVNFACPRVVPTSDE